MSLITKNFTFSAGASIIASEHNSNFDTIYSDYNGNITNANISASASIADTKLAQITTAQKVNISSLVATSQSGGSLLYTSGTTTVSLFSMGTSSNAYVKAGPVPTMGYPKFTWGGSIPVATTLLVPPTGNMFLVTGGTTDVTGISISGSDKDGAYIFITQSGPITYVDGTTFKISADFVTNLNDSFTVAHDGVTNFYEIGRSSN